MKKIVSLFLVIVFLMMPCWAFGVTSDDKGSVKITDNNTEFAIETAEIIDEAESFDDMLRIIGKSKKQAFKFRKLQNRRCYCVK